MEQHKTGSARHSKEGEPGLGIRTRGADTMKQGTRYSNNAGAGVGSMLRISHNMDKYNMAIRQNTEARGKCRGETKNPLSSQYQMESDYCDLLAAEKHPRVDTGTTIFQSGNHSATSK